MKISAKVVTLALCLTMFSCETNGTKLRGLTRHLDAPELHKTLPYENMLLLEGDIAIEKRDGVEVFDYKNDQATWPNATVRFQIAKEVDRNLVLSAVSHVTKKTGIAFLECPDCGPAKRVDFINFQKGTGCWSYIGYKQGWYVQDPARLGMGAGQPISVDTSCSTGNLIHEISHALGLWHEHTRPDRDKYISVLTENIVKDYESNFEVNYGGYFFGDYDYNSVMHYRAGAFSVDSTKNTIVARDSSRQDIIGQRVSLSTKDIRAIKLLYKLSDVSDPNTEQPEIVSYAANVAPAATSGNTEIQLGNSDQQKIGGITVSTTTLIALGGGVVAFIFLVAVVSIWITKKHAGKTGKTRPKSGTLVINTPGITPGVSVAPHHMQKTILPTKVSDARRPTAPGGQPARKPWFTG